MRPKRELNEHNKAGLDLIYNRAQRAYNKMLISESRRGKYSKLSLVTKGEYDEIEIHGSTTLKEEFIEVVGDKHAKSKSFKVLLKALKQYSPQDQERYIELKEDA